jgi:hypothetical protein
MLVTGYGPGGPASIPGIVKDLPAQHERVWRWVGAGGGTELYCSVVVGFALSKAR